MQWTRLLGEEIATAIENGDTIAIKFNKSSRYYFVDNNGNIEGPIDIVFDATPGALEGEGTETDPFIIMSIEDLVYLSKQVNITKNTYSGQYIALGKDLDFESDLSYVDVNTTVYEEYLGGDGTTGLKEQLTTGKGFNPIGQTKELVFGGTFEGNNNEIKNLYINNTLLTNVGLFGYVSGGTIKNLELKGKIVSTKDSAIIGGIIGNAYISNIFLVDNCYSKVEIKDTAATGGFIGGIVGYGNSEVTINNCGNEGEIISENSTVGGITNYYVEEIKGCYNNADLITNGICGGIMGYANYAGFNIENCTNAGTITSTNKSAGGIGGELIVSGTATINNCKNEGKVSGKTASGGIVGQNSRKELIIKNCYNNGNVTSSSNCVGGIGGVLANCEVIYCYNNGKINGTNIIGGIVGECYYMSSVTLTNCWNNGNIGGNTYVRRFFRSYK